MGLSISFLLGVRGGGGSDKIHRKAIKYLAITTQPGDLVGKEFASLCIFLELGATFIVLQHREHVARTVASEFATKGKETLRFLPISFEAGIGANKIPSSQLMAYLCATLLATATQGEAFGVLQDPSCAFATAAQAPTVGQLIGQQEARTDSVCMTLALQLLDMVARTTT